MSEDISEYSQMLVSVYLWDSYIDGNTHIMNIAGIGKAAMAAAATMQQ